MFAASLSSALTPGADELRWSRPTFRTRSASALYPSRGLGPG